MARAQMEQPKSVRLEAPEWSETYSDDQRKRLGQYFTGRRLGRLLAALAIDSQTRTVVDPMCGTGDLLEAAALVADVQGVTLECLSGIEIDTAAATGCRRRLADLVANGLARSVDIGSGNAFDNGAIATLARPSYDCVIANPPYVRYQSLTENCRETQAPSGPDIRNGLLKIAKSHPALSDRATWKQIALGYSGHADLSIPSWILCAMLVAPGGLLALVVPATWRSREYADIIRYMMVREFETLWVVEDTQPGWFSDALVRTNLMIARRREASTSIRSIEGQAGAARWLSVSPAAATSDSIVGRAFPVDQPELACAEWLRGGCVKPVLGIDARTVSMAHEIAWLKAHASRRKWYRDAEHHPDQPVGATNAQTTIPEAIHSVLPSSSTSILVTPSSVGIQIGQGLRTGCNKFFYVRTVGDWRDDAPAVLVELPELFPDEVFEIPRSVLRPVLRRQAEIRSFERGETLAGRLLDLRDWVLPEDAGSRPTEDRRIMRGELAELVREAAKLNIGSADRPVYIPELSAVRTNVRSGAKGSPRFWYMLPDLAARHTPALFVPRVIHGVPAIVQNGSPPTIIDANFSTVWTDGGGWSQDVLAALFNSIWCRTCMELMGTPMGGGALKLEAAQLRRLPLPSLSSHQKKELARFMKNGSGGNNGDAVDDLVLSAVTGQTGAPIERAKLQLHQIVDRIGAARRR